MEKGHGGGGGRVLGVGSSFCSGQPGELGVRAKGEVQAYELWRPGGLGLAPLGEGIGHVLPAAGLDRLRARRESKSNGGVSS